MWHLLVLLAQLYEEQNICLVVSEQIFSQNTYDSLVHKIIYKLTVSAFPELDPIIRFSAAKTQCLSTNNV